MKMGLKQRLLSIKYTERLAEAGVEPSVGSVGDSYDNALAETINGLYRTEVIHRRGPWRSYEAVEFATPEWVDWFNMLEPIGNIAPAGADYATLEEPGSLTQTKRPPVTGGSPPSNYPALLGLDQRPPAKIAQVNLSLAESCGEAFGFQ